jgi:sulfite exporter TauE/SafE
MALFGLGTVPALIGFTLGGAALAPALPREHVRVLAGVLVLIGALWTGVGGLAHRSHGHLDHHEGAGHELPAAAPPAAATAAPHGTARMPAPVGLRP